MQPNQRHAAQQQQQRLKTYFSHHKHAFTHGVRQITRNPFASLLTIAVLSISLVLPTGLLLILGNIKTYTNNWQTGTTISVYLKTNIKSAQRQYLENAIKNMGNIANTQYIPPEQGIKEFAERSGLKQIIETLGKNPLPGVIIIKPADQSAAAVNILVSQLKALPNIGNVKLDMEWVKRLQAIINLFQRFTYALTFLLACGVLLIVSNTIRMTIQSYHHEIEVIKLVGGSNTFTRRPFLYSGAMYGLASGIFSAIIVDFFLLWLQTPLNNFTKLYNIHVDLSGLSFSQTLLLLALSLLLGYLGSWLVVDKHLKRINPE